MNEEENVSWIEQFPENELEINNKILIATMLAE